MFEKHNVDYAVIEVGLGGNLDATNIVLPEIAVLTNVGLDHVEILGDTVEKIAKDKAGIIKNNITVITGAYQKSVLSIFQKICKEKKSELFILGKDFHILDNVSLKLYGKAQVQNASLAYYVSKKLLGEKYNKKQALQALEKTSIAARIEILQEEPLVILDGAHNSIKIKASIESIRKLSNGRKIYTLFALKDDKDYEDIFTEINNISQNITCTEFIEKLYWKSYDAVGLAKKFAALYPDSFIKSDKNCLNALKRLMKIIKKDEILWVVGSLYLAGDIRECWVSSESILKKLE
ncbi:MAG: dihydrofolate synthase/folylpolyglutamate synthase [Flavobacteriaceae bacterium]